jgi:hypothetical protein
MPGFRRAQLRGSEELFQPTRGNTGEPPATRFDSVEVPASAPHQPPVQLAPEGRLVRLTDEEVQTLAEAVQGLKFPAHKPGAKPPIDEYERLEALRQKLLSVL